jgi:hypothetical protein
VVVKSESKAVGHLTLPPASQLLADSVSLFEKGTYRFGQSSLQFSSNPVM